MATDDPTIPGDPPRWREVFRGRQGRLTTGLLLLEALVAIQSLVVATIMPDIRRDLGMVQLYGLAFTASSLATLAAIPIVGRAVDRVGPRGVVPPVLGLFACGLLIAATAPTMPVLLLGQFTLGAGGGGLYALSIGIVAKTYPDRLRPRVLALFATMWILPGLVGPPLAATIASTVGWRWAFVAPLPILVFGWLLIGPALHTAGGDGSSVAPVSVRWPVQLMVGAGLVFSSVTTAQLWALVPIAAGIAILGPALRRIVPPGTFRAAPGLPAVAASAFLLSFGFLAMDAFLTLMLTDVRNLSLAQASLAITAAAVTWSLGSAWQSGRAERIPLPRLAVGGTLVVLLGQVMVATSLWTCVPLGAAFAGWALVGLGMGVAFPSLALAAMRLSSPGGEAGELSSVLLMDMLGVATGAGIGGGAVALAEALGRPLREGIAWSFALGLLALVVLTFTARLIAPSREASARSSDPA